MFGNCCFHVEFSLIFLMIWKIYRHVGHREKRCFWSMPQLVSTVWLREEYDHRMSCQKQKQRPKVVLYEPSPTKTTSAAEALFYFFYFFVVFDVQVAPPCLPCFVQVTDKYLQHANGTEQEVAQWRRQIAGARADATGQATQSKTSEGYTLQMAGLQAGLWYNLRKLVDWIWLVSAICLSKDM